MQLKIVIVVVFLAPSYRRGKFQFVASFRDIVRLWAFVMARIARFVPGSGLNKRMPLAFVSPRGPPGLRKLEHDVLGIVETAENHAGDIDRPVPRSGFGAGDLACDSRLG